MPIEFKQEMDWAEERSTVRFNCAFLDSDGAAKSPNTDTIVWTLTDANGTVINSREQVAISSASTINIVLTGPDLQILAGETAQPHVNRILTIEAEYDSTYGTDLSLRDQATFIIKNLAYIENP